mgnify:FL=1
MLDCFVRDGKRSCEEMNRNETLSLCLGLLTALLSGATDVHVCSISILLLISTLFLLLSISFGFESMAKLKQRRIMLHRKPCDFLSQLAKVKMFRVFPAH